MKRLILVLLATTLATPAFAQHGGHAQPASQAPADPHAGHAAQPEPPAPAPTSCTPEHAAMGHCVMPRPTPAPAAPPPSSCTAEHAAMGHCQSTAREPVDPHAGHDQPAQSATDPHAGHGAGPQPQPPPGADPHAGHQMPSGEPATAAHADHAMPSGQADAHSGHQTEGQEAAPPAPPPAPPPAGAFSGPEHAADTIFGAQAMRPSRRELVRSHGRMATHRFRFDRLEAGFGDGSETYAWDADFFYGEPLDRLWIKTEGEGAFGGKLERGEVQALWSHALTPFFDLQTGLRYDFAPDPNRGHLVLGVQGTAPYWFEVDAAAFLSDKGELTARLEGEYDLLITQRLILQPRLEIELSLQDMPELRIGSGLTSAEAGLRLRYEIVPEFAPYLGVEYERAFGDTADFRRAGGDEVDGLSLVVGVRTWF